MADDNKNPVLGTIDCSECGQMATVHQTARGKGKFLYTRCPECKADQRTGKAFQQRLWNETIWRGEKPVAPSNVDDDWQPAAPKTTESQPESEPKKAVQQPVKAPKSGGLLVLGIGAVIGAVLYLKVIRQPKSQPQIQPYGGAHYG